MEEQLRSQIEAGRRVDIPEELKQWLARSKDLYINGTWTPGRGTFADVSPVTEEKICDIAEADPSQVDLAVQGARQAFEGGAWAGRSLAERAAVLHKIADRIDAHRATLAVIESLDQGKPITESFHGDILRAASNFRFFADYAQEDKPLAFDNGPDRHTAYREPLGVAALITPWNLPLYLETWKIAPALMMGNSVILKPSELTPLTAAYFTELVEDLLPPGVFQLLQGRGDKSTGEALVSHPGVRGISFTGETRTGRAIMKCASVGPAKVSFELGGKGALVVFEDADVERAALEAVRAGFRNQGEICLACPRIYVHSSRYAAFMESFVAKVKAIRVGDPLDPQTTMGALVGKEHFDKVLGYLQDIGSGKFLTGGKAIEGKGYFLQPTVIEGLGPDHPITRDEVFGPVVSVYQFETEDEVVEAVNDTPYGLSSSIWTRDPERAQRVGRRFQHGLLWVNCWFVRDLRVPFGGQKGSGVGREGGKFSLDFFSEWKSICVRTEEDHE